MEILIYLYLLVGLFMAGVFLVRNWKNWKSTFVPSTVPTWERLVVGLIIIVIWPRILFDKFWRFVDNYPEHRSRVRY